MRRFLGAVGRTSRSALREWPLALALLGTASLFLVPRVAASGAFRERREAETRLESARAVLLRIRFGEAPALEGAARVREHLSVSPNEDLSRELALLLLARGYAGEAAAVARAPDLLALCLAAQASQEPDRAESLLGQARSHAAGVPAERLDGVLLRVVVEARAGRTAASLAVVADALPRFSGADAGRLQLERGRLLGRLDRKVEALAALDLAAEALAGADDVRLAEAEILLGAGGAELDRVAGPVARKGGPLAPAARVLLALSDPGREALVSTLAALRGPEPLEDARLDPFRIAAHLRAARETETEPEALARNARALAELNRLYPGFARLALELGSAWRRAAERAAPADAPSRHRSAGEAFAVAAGSRRLEGAALEVASREAAASFEAGGDLVRAASLHRAHFDLDPGRNVDGLFRQADCLARAGAWRPGAVEVLGEYLDRAGPGAARVPRALLARGRLLEALGDRAPALADYERVLREDHGISPRTPEWEEALLARGRCLLERAREDATLRAEGRRVLAEYLERYASETPPRAGSVEAAFLLAQGALEDRDSGAALVALAQAAELPASDDRSRALQRDARHLLGDVLLAEGRPAEAELAYARAGRGAADGLDRVWSLAGRARALARMGRLAEAREEHRRAAAICEKSRTDAFWRAELDAVARELR